MASIEDASWNARVASDCMIAKFFAISQYCGDLFHLHSGGRKKLMEKNATKIEEDNGVSDDSSIDSLDSC